MADDNKTEQDTETTNTRRAFLTGVGVAGVAGVLAATGEASAAGGCAPIDRDKLHEIIGKYLLDPVFRQAFDQDAGFAVDQVGISLTDNERQAIGSIQADLAQFAASPEVQQVADDLTAYIDRSVQG